MTAMNPSFEQLLHDEVRAARVQPRLLPRGECVDTRDRRCGLCLRGTLPYDIEEAIKRRAIARFWKAGAYGGRLDDLVPSPAGREYRTVSKRRVFRHGRAVVLGLIDRSRNGITPVPVIRCAVEPEAHNAVYRIIQHELLRERFAPLAAAMRYAIVKGMPPTCFVLLNVGSVAPEIVRVSNQLSKILTGAIPAVAGIFLVAGGDDDQFYMGKAGGSDPRRLRKLFGASELATVVGGRPYRFSPASFSQVNQQMLDVFVGQVRALLEPGGQTSLIDLYCGYGLFALSLAPSYRRVTGVEISQQSIHAARMNATRQKAAHVRFIRSPITGETIGGLLKGLDERDAVLLDPPRNGTEPEVIETIAERRPATVVHVFCNPDVIAPELARWRRGGYQIVRAVPLDMFPGTSIFEMLVALRPRT